MLQTSELLNKVRRLEIRTSRVVDEVIGGAYHSVFKGRGIEFDEVREYTVDDDIRDIDWNVSARLNAPYVKKYIEERELSVLLLMDVSGSMGFPGAGASVRQCAIEVAALLGLSAIRNNDRVGLSLFSDKIELFLTPRSGRHNGLRLIRELVNLDDGNNAMQRTDGATALKNACGVLKKRSVIFLISDLIDLSDEFEKALRIANRRHDVIVLHCFDPRLNDLPRDFGNLYDAENGGFLRLNSRRARARFGSFNAELMQKQQALCRRAGVEVIELVPGEDILKSLLQFFRRRRRAGRGR